MSDVSEELEVSRARSVDRQGRWAAFSAEEGFSERRGMKNGLTIETDVQTDPCLYLESNSFRWMK